MSKKIELAKKLKALADRSIGGEKDNAERMLRDLMKKHKITTADIEGLVIDDHFFFAQPDDMDLYRQITATINTGIKAYGPFPESKIKKLKLDGNYILTCTVAEFMEIRAKFDFYSRLLKEEYEVFFYAFCLKNKLLPTATEEEEQRFTEDDIKKAARARAMASGIKEELFHRQIEAQ